MSETIKGYTFEEWKFSTGGEICFASKGGKKYFLKKYQDPVKPKSDSESSSPARYRRNMEIFDKFMEYRQKINDQLRSIAGSGGCIILPIDYFVYPEEGRFVEVSEFIDNIVEPEDVIRLPYEEKMVLLMTAVKALGDVHRLGIVHGDLKYSNVLVVKSETGKYKAKILDFDCSYFKDQPPKGDIGGDQIYASPEVGNFMISEGDPEAAAYLGVKSDIFSMGLVLHYYLTGELPKTTKNPDPDSVGENPYIFEVLLYGGEVTVSPKIKDAYIKALITDMIKRDPENRPDAMTVYMALKDKRWHGVGAADAAPAPAPTPAPAPRVEAYRVFDEPWPEDGITLNIDQLKSQGVVGVKKIAVGSRKVYEFYYSSKPCSKATVENMLMMDLCTRGSAPRSTSAPTPRPTSTPTPAPASSEYKVFDEPWPEHGITLNVEQLKRQGVVGVKKIMVGSRKVYEFYYSSKPCSKTTVENMLMMELCTRGATPHVEAAPVAPTPALEGGMWPEDEGYEFIEDSYKNDGFSEISRIEKSGRHCYALMKDGAIVQVKLLSHLQLMGYVRKK